MRDAGRQSNYSRLYADDWQAPPLPDHPLRNLPNVILTPHIAGAVTRNILRNGAFAVREIINFAEGKPLVYPVDLSSLDKIA